MPDPEQLLTLDDVAARLNVKRAQVYALVRRKDLRAVKLGGRGVWRIRLADLEAFIEAAFNDTAKWIDEHPYTEGEPPPDDEPVPGLD